METNKIDRRTIEIIDPDENTQRGYVTLPYSPTDFKDFIVSLLGKPQVLEGVFNGYYSFDKGDILNLHHLIEQRVLQNDSSLVAISIQIVFDDNSSIVLNDLESFRAYNELRPIIPVSIHLTWIYLIKFQTKNAPEKQVINISIGSYHNLPEKNIFERKYMKYNESAVSYNIQNTDRTWSVDIENLLRNHFSTKLRKQTKFKEYLNEIDYESASPIFFTILSLISSFFAVMYMKKRIMAEYHELVFEKASNLDVLTKKIDWLSEFFSSGLWANFFFGIIVYLAFSILISIPIGSYVDKKTSSSEPSFLLFTKSSYDYKEEREKRQIKKWRGFMTALLVGIISGIIGNVVFALYFSKIFTY